MTAPPRRPPWLDGLAGALDDPDRLRRLHTAEPTRMARRSAVLVLFSDGASGPEVLLVERAATLRTHPGQIAFPGGAADPDEVDLADTALREAWEETGVEPTGVTVLGALPPVHVAVSGFDVTAVVAWWHEPGEARAVDKAEVAAVLRVPVADLTDPAHRVQVRHPSGYTGPAFEVAGHLVWGLTGLLLDAVLDLAGWQRPWDRTRRVGIPERYLRGRPRTPARDGDR